MTIASRVEVSKVRLVKGTGTQIASARQAGEILDTDLVVQIDAPEPATAEQGALADTALQPGDNITELVNNADYATNTQVGSAVSTHNTDQSAHSYIQGLISSEESRAEGVEGTLSNLTTDVKNNLVSAINEVDSHADTNASDISNIKALIPNDASTSNQLADKGFVNSSIATNTANFIGTFNSVAELEAYSGTLTNNDYAFVIGTDSAGNTVYDRYKYTDSTTPASWIFEYELNNSSFTADQWASINSLATAGKITQITTNQNAIGNLSSLTTTAKTSLVSAINELDSDKLDKNTAITGATKCKITYDGKGLVTEGADLSANDIPSLTLSKISDITATASELNVLDGITASTTELNYTDGVTSNIQTQLNGKVPNTRTINGKALSSNITLNAGDVGALPNSTAIPSKTSDLTNDSGFISGITSLMVTTALGYTPYNSSNPAGYISGITSSMVTAALGYTPYNSSNPAGYISGITSAMVTTALGYTPQQQLVSGTNIKTINNNSILGSGNISTSDSTKANTSLDNLDSTGQAVIDGKVDLNLNNMNPSASAKETIVGWGMPDFSSGVSKSLDTIYQAESDGWILIRGQGNGSTATFVLNYSANNDMSNPIEVAGDYFNCSNNETKLLPIPKGMYYQATQTISYFSMIFYPVKGEVNA